LLRVDEIGQNLPVGGERSGHRRYHHRRDGPGQQPQPGGQRPG
jgi:hypothetical protein